MLCSHASRSHVSGLPCDVFPSASLSPPPLPGLTFDGDGGTTRCPDSIRRPTVGVGRLGACTTPTTVTCYATTTDSDYRCGVPPHVALRVHTHAGGTIPWYTSTDVARVTTVVAGEPSIHAVNSPGVGWIPGPRWQLLSRLLVTRPGPRRLSGGPQLAAPDAEYSSHTSRDWTSTLQYQRATVLSSTHVRPADQGLF